MRLGGSMCLRRRAHQQSRYGTAYIRFASAQASEAQYSHSGRPAQPSVLRRPLVTLQPPRGASSLGPAAHRSWLAGDIARGADARGAAAEVKQTTQGVQSAWGPWTAHGGRRPCGFWWEVQKHRCGVGRRRERRSFGASLSANLPLHLRGAHLRLPV